MHEHYVAAAEKCMQQGITAKDFPLALRRHFENEPNPLFSLLVPDDYGNVYMHLLTSKRKENSFSRNERQRVKNSDLSLFTGIYTPKWIADDMAKRAFSEFPVSSVREIKVLDPACGGGQLLLSAYRILRERYLAIGVPREAIPYLIFEYNLRGCDLDADAVSVAELSLWREAYKDAPEISLQKISFALSSDFSESDDLSLYGSLSLSFPQGSKTQRLLSDTYDIVLMNPPYMGKKQMPSKLLGYLAEHFPCGKNDLYAAFLLRGIALLREGGVLSFLSIHTWMFLSSFRDLRMQLLTETTLLSVVHLGAGIFSELHAFNALSAILTLKKSLPPSSHAISFLSLTKYVGANEKRIAFSSAEKKLLKQEYFFSYSGAPLLYMLPEEAYSILKTARRLGDLFPIRQGLATGDNDRFVRYWFIPHPDTVGFHISSAEEAALSGKRWFPYNKGGFYRKWYGMNEYVVDYAEGGRAILENRNESGKLRSRPQNREFYFRRGITWSLFGFENFGVRYKDAGFIFDVSGSSLFAPDEELLHILAFLAGNVAFYFLAATAPTVNFQVGNIANLPYIPPRLEDREEIRTLVKENIALMREDWDEREISFDFSRSPLLKYKKSLEQAYFDYAAEKNEKRERLRRNEERLNSMYIELYGLRGIVSEKVNDRDLSLKKICLAETMRDLFSYYVMTAVGRYSENIPGFYPLGIQPLFLDETEVGFVEFLAKHFGEDDVKKHLLFFENGVGMSVKKYIAKEFYKDHLRRYRKHPILRIVDWQGRNAYLPIHFDGKIPQ